MKEHFVNRRQFLSATGGCAIAASMSGTVSAQSAGEVPFSAGINAPAFKTPVKVCDSHFHIYNHAFPAAPNASLTPPDASVADYGKLCKRLGTERGVIVQPSTYGTDNSCLLDALGKLGTSYRAVAVVDTTVTDKELERLNSFGVRGIRFNLGRAGATTVDMIEPLSKRAAELGWHIQVHMKGDEIAQQADLFSRLPVPVVFDHLGRIPQPQGTSHEAYGLVSKLLKDGKAWVKVSSLYQDTTIGPPTYADLADVALGYIKAAPDRVLWGSDWPHPSRGKFGTPDDALLMDTMVKWAGDEKTAERILVDNPALLYGF